MATGKLLNDLRDAMATASGVIVKRHLLYGDLPHGANDSRDASIDRFLRYVDEGKISAEDAWRAVLEFREFSDKKIYLFSVDGLTASRFKKVALPKATESWAQASIKNTPSAPFLNYSLRSTDFIRITFSETHRRAAFAPNASTPHTESDTKIVSATILEDGFAYLAYDQPWVSHPHATTLAYFAYYRAQVESLLSATLTPFDLGDSMTALEGTKLVRIPSGRIVTSDGEANLKTDHDIREMNIFAGVQKDAKARQGGRYYWAAEEEHAESVLRRELRTIIQAQSGLVRFTQDTVANEVNYVVRQLRAHAE